MNDDDQRNAVDTLLRQAGLTVPDEEVQRLASLYGGLRHSIDRFHAIDVGDEVQAGIPRTAEAAPAADGPGSGTQGGGHE